MEELVTIESVMENFTLFSTKNDFISFNQVKTWRRSVILNEKNIFVLINFFQENSLAPPCQIFIISIIRDIIYSHFNSLPLPDISIKLSQTAPEILTNQSVTLILGILIGNITRFVYQNEHNFLFPIMEDQSTCTNLQWAIYHNILECMDQPRNECTEGQNNQIIASFKAENLISFFNLSLNSIDTESETQNAIHLLLMCIRFDVSKGRRLPITLDDTTNEILTRLQDDSLFEKFISIVLNSNSPLSSDTVELMSAILNSMRMITISEGHPCYPLIEKIIRFCIEILNCPDFFKDMNNVNGLKNVFQSFPKMEATEQCQQLSLELFSFLECNLHSNYLLAIEILTSTQKFFENIITYISHETTLYENFTTLLDIFIETTLIALETDPVNVYNSILLDSTMRNDTKELVKFLFRLSEHKKNDSIVHICESISDLIGQPFNSIINLQLGFLLFVLRTVFPNSIDENNSSISLIYETGFKLFLFTDDKIDDYMQCLEEDEPFAIEFYSLAFLKTFSKLFLNAKKISISDAIEKNVPELLNLFESPEAVVIFVFQRFWNDMMNNVCIEKSSSCLRNFIKLSRIGLIQPTVLDIISTTDFPEEFLENYLDFNPKSVIYDTVINVMYSNEDIRPKFLESLEDNFLGKDDDESLKKLFKIFASWFDCQKEPTFFKSTYLYFISNFADSCFKASTNSSVLIRLLKLLYKIILNIPESNPFNPNEPYSFEMMDKMMSLLTNITNEVTQFLTPIEIDDTVFETVFDLDIFDSKPISLSEAHEIGLNERQLKIKMISIPKIENIDESDSWSIINVIIFIVINLLKSSIANFGIMEFYNDDCIFVFLEKLIVALSKTSAISIVSQEQQYFDLVEELSEFIQIVLANFRNVVVSDETFCGFVLEFTRVTFLSHNRDVVKKNCSSLCDLIRGFDDQKDIEILRTHFILAFNAALYLNDCFSVREFVFEFILIDPDFFTQIGGLIENDLNQEVCKKAFHESFQLLLKNFDDIHEKNEKNLRQKLLDCFESFLDSITPHSIKLYSLPSLAHYFDFQSLF